MPYNSVGGGGRGRRWKTPPSLMRPLSDQLKASPGPEHPRGVITRPVRPLPGNTPEPILERLRDELQSSTEQRSAIARLLARGQGPNVLETATIVIPAQGQEAGFEPGAPGVYTQDRYRVPYASVAVLNLAAGGGGQGSVASGIFTAPTAGTVLATTPTLAAGTYQVDVTNELLGSAAVADITNFGVYVGATQIGAAAGGNTPISTAFVATVPAGGATISIRAVVNGTATIVYVTSLGVSPLSGSGNAVTVSSGPPQGSAPGPGQGSFIVPGNAFVAFNLAGSSLSIYGTAGTQISYSVMTDRIQPIASIL